MSKRSTTKYIIVHCAATKPTMDIGAAEIDRWHRERGWLKIGYHFVIRRDGTLETGRKIDAVGAHCRGQNHHSIGICLVGGIDEDGKPENNFTGAQYDALATLLHDLHDKYADAEVVPHNQFANKACPSFDVKAWWSSRTAPSNECPHPDCPMRQRGN